MAVFARKLLALHECFAYGAFSAGESTICCQIPWPLIKGEFCLRSVGLCLLFAC